jgi:hypothetical protein
VILVRLGNANRLPLDDRVDVHVVSTSTNATVSVARDVPGTSPVKFERLIERQTYQVKVFPVRHRPIAQFVTAGSDETPAVVQMYAPLHPDHVRVATFPEYGEVHADLRRVLDASRIDGVTGQGAALYAALGDTQKAGLFNLYSKMAALVPEADVEMTAAAAAAAPLTVTADAHVDARIVEADLQVRPDLQVPPVEQRHVWSFVDRLFGVRGDRIFVDVKPALIGLVQAAVASGQFRGVPGSLHDPPAGFDHAGSFKSGERYGNLQLTFFSRLPEGLRQGVPAEQAPLAFKVDADIDDAAGLGHAFQVLRNFVTKGTTHPYDIHQILVFRQETRPPYDLA